MAEPGMEGMDPPEGGGEPLTNEQLVLTKEMARVLDAILADGNFRDYLRHFFGQVLAEAPQYWAGFMYVPNVDAPCDQQPEEWGLGPVRMMYAEDDEGGYDELPLDGSDEDGDEGGGNGPHGITPDAHRGVIRAPAFDQVKE